MTDYEILSLFNEMASNTQAVFMNYVTILFAFLIASFFIADRLSRAMTVIVLVVFTVAAFQEGAALMFHWSDQQGIMSYIAARDDLSWHGAQSGGPLMGSVFDFTNMFAVVAGYVGALIFFFEKRRATDQ